MRDDRVLREIGRLATAAIVCFVLGSLGWHPWALWTAIGALGFDFDEVLMICTGLAALAYVVVDFKRERETQAYLVALHEDLGRIKTMVGWDLPRSLGERVTVLETRVPDDLPERLASIETEGGLDKRVEALEHGDLIDRVTAVEHAIGIDNDRSISDRVLVLEASRPERPKRQRKPRANEVSRG